MIEGFDPSSVEDRDLLLATALLDRDIPASAVEEALLESDPSAVRWKADAVVWGNYKISREELAHARQRRLVSFGCCSFPEPVEELAQFRIRIPAGSPPAMMAPMSARNHSGRL